MRLPEALWFRPCAAAALAAVVAACGGGGSGSSAIAPPESSARETPLQLTAANARDAASLGFGFGTLALGLGQLAVDWTEELNSSGGPTVVRMCGGGGSLNLSLVDNDGNRRAGAGDRLNVSASNCFLKPLEGAFTGTLAIDLVQPGDGQVLVGAISLVSPLSNTSDGIAIGLAGGVRFEHSANRLSKTIRTTSSEQPFRILASSGSNSLENLVTLLDARREIRRDTARTATSVSLRLASDFAGGSVVVSTSSPWGSWFDTYPDTGTLTVSGASTTQVQLRAASDGDGVVEVSLNGVAVGVMHVNDTAPLYPWSSTGWVPVDESTPPYEIRPVSLRGFRNVTSPGSSLSPNPLALVWAYSRPLAAGTLGSAAFMRQMEGPGDSWASAFIPATVQIEGALLSVSPTSQLEPGNTYALVFDNQFLTPISDSSGTTTDRPALTVSVATTITAIAQVDGPAVMLPGASLSLDASASTVPNGTVASTTWRQLSGPTVVFSTSNSPRTQIVATGSDSGDAVIEVEVRNAAGDHDLKRLTIAVVGASSQTVVIAHRKDGQPWSLVTSTAATTSYARYFAASNAVDVIVSPGARFLAVPPSGQTWLSGTDFVYPAGGANLSWLPPEGPCAGALGHVSVLNFALDGSGTVLSLAIDFEEFCNGVQTLGSVRFNSSLPLRP